MAPHLEYCLVPASRMLARGVLHLEEVRAACGFDAWRSAPPLCDLEWKPGLWSALEEEFTALFRNPARLDIREFHRFGEDTCKRYGLSTRLFPVGSLWDRPEYVTTFMEVVARRFAQTLPAFLFGVEFVVEDGPHAIMITTKVLHETDFQLLRGDVLRYIGRFRLPRDVARNMPEWQANSWPLYIRDDVVRPLERARDMECDFFGWLA